MKIRLFWFLWSFDALISAVVLIFFFIGIADGSVSSYNFGLWLFILLALALILGGGYWFKTLGHQITGIILLLVLAIPGFLYGIFVFLMVVTQNSWN